MTCVWQALTEAVCWRSGKRQHELPNADTFIEAENRFATDPVENLPQMMEVMSSEAMLTYRDQSNSRRKQDDDRKKPKRKFPYPLKRIRNKA